MSSEDVFIGCPYDVDGLRSLNDRLNTKVMEQINSTQELVMLNNFAQESNEYILRKSLQERMSEVESWRWVLVDLTKRLEEAIGALQHEGNALRVVLQRVQDEIDGHSREASRPGALSPLSDSVEDAIMQELNFLREQKIKFETMIPDLHKQIQVLTKTNKKIENDILNKQQALSIDESCLRVHPNSSKIENDKKKKKRALPLIRWEKRCESLKRAGLKALTNAIITREQALRDYKALEEELTTTEQNILDTLEQERLVQSRLADRVLKPTGEHTRDNVDKKLKDELGRLKCFSKHLQKNHERITILQNSLTDCISRVSCCAEDIIQVVRLDEERIHLRIGEEVSERTTAPQDSSNGHTLPTNSRVHNDVLLTSIQEEDEDDYPFDD